MTASAVVLLSGGLDSATTLAIAQNQGFTCHCLSFDYGQRHRAELEAAGAIARSLRAATHRLFTLDLAQFGGSALTDSQISVPTDGTTAGIPVTYVPARNTVLLSLALAFAETLRARDIFIGINAVDYSGYPDCRPEYLRAFQAMADLATREGVGGRTITIHAPLIEMSKADIIRCGSALNVDYASTVSCYQADANGNACGSCDACRLRAIGFREAAISDPTRYQAHAVKPLDTSR
ncbi:MAG TPA: 7-cyano-7-deazaguanine synthase QueC [Rhodocyclaceae bacterium]